MKHTFFIILFVISVTLAQTKTENRFTFGIQAEYVDQGGDLGKYWGNAVAGGFYVDYKLTENFYYEFSFNLSKVSEAEFNNSVLPAMIILNIPLGGVIKQSLSSTFKFNTFVGIESIMMIFDKTKNHKKNLDESEFCVTVSVGLNYIPFDMEVFIKYKNMFSEPESTQFVSFGLKKRLF